MKEGLYLGFVLLGRVRYIVVRVLYHLTPERNLRSILREGLGPGWGKSLAVGREVTGDRLFLARSKEEALYNLWNTLINNFEDIKGIRNWSLLEVRVPSGFPLFEDDYGFLYSTETIPPSLLRVIMKDSASDKRIRRLVKEWDEGGRFDELHGDIF